MSAAAVDATPLSLVLPGLTGLLQQAADAAGAFVTAARGEVRAQVSGGGKIDRVLADVEQHRVHGFGWYASYAELMNQVAGWAARLEAEGAFGETEALLAQLLFAEYCTQLVGGIPMNQGEMVRPADLTASRETMDRLFAPALVQLMTQGGGQAVKTRLADLVAAARGKPTVE
ncbi:MAG TPA: acyl-CoA dehydrogenase, partial [Caulobacter sp.]|nr:acyl-CoA dehydrogenase [Caulobacter sp.]